MKKRAASTHSLRHSAKQKRFPKQIKKKKSKDLEISTRGVHGSRAPHRADGGFAEQLTSQKREQFLEQLRTHSNVTKACEEIGFSKVSLYALKKRDAEFSKEWDLAIKEGVTCLEDEAKRRATGYEEEVYFKGEYRGTVKKYSDILLITLLNAHWPEKYRRNNAETQPPVSPDDQRRLAEARNVLQRLDTDELAAIATVMEKATERAVARAVAPNGKRTLQ